MPCVHQDTNVVMRMLAFFFADAPFSERIQGAGVLMRLPINLDTKEKLLDACAEIEDLWYRFRPKLGCTP